MFTASPAVLEPLRDAFPFAPKPVPSRSCHLCPPLAQLQLVGFVPEGWFVPSKCVDDVEAILEDSLFRWEEENYYLIQDPWWDPYNKKNSSSTQGSQEQQPFAARATITLPGIRLPANPSARAALAKDVASAVASKLASLPVRVEALRLLQQGQQAPLQRLLLQQAQGAELPGVKACLDARVEVVKVEAGAGGSVLATVVIWFDPSTTEPEEVAALADHMMDWLMPPGALLNLTWGSTSAGSPRSGGSTPQGANSTSSGSAGSHEQSTTLPSHSHSKAQEAAYKMVIPCIITFVGLSLLGCCLGCVCCCRRRRARRRAAAAAAAAAMVAAKEGGSASKCVHDGDDGASIVSSGGSCGGRSSSQEVPIAEVVVAVREEENQDKKKEAASEV